MSDFKIEKDNTDRFGNLREPKVTKVALKNPEEAMAVPMELPDNCTIEVGEDMAKRSLAPNPNMGTYDPFAEYKTEPDKYFYYAVNTRPLIRQERERQGFELIPEAVHGDLVLARMSKEKHETMVRKEEQKAKAQLRAPKESYKEEMKRMGAGDLVEEE